jgi:hypothetical protein
MCYSARSTAGATERVSARLGLGWVGLDGPPAEVKLSPHGLVKGLQVSGRGRAYVRVMCACIRLSLAGSAPPQIFSPGRPPPQPSHSFLPPPTFLASSYPSDRVASSPPHARTQRTHKARQRTALQQHPARSVLFVWLRWLRCVPPRGSERETHSW